MRLPLIHWGKMLRRNPAEEFERRYGRAFLVTDPASVFNVPDGPMNTARIDLNLYRASQEGSFHESTPVFSLQRRDDSVYSFISIGRTENCDVALRDESVSKLHALVRDKDGVITIRDASASNPTLKNQTPIATREDKDATPLADGDQLAFGNIVMHFLTRPALERLLDEVVPDWRTRDEDRME